jgi:protein-S-isoprenylcysteine O-methyltransferase Ste14
VELYSSFMKLAPLLILELLATGRFGPSGQDEDGQGRMAFAGDVVLMVAVVVGGVVSILVLGEVLPPTATTRGVLVVAGCLSLLVLANFKLGQIASLYRVRPRARRLVGTSGGASAYPGESS